ncbi:tyrosine-type recombinase/integrase [Marinisporobacter balticus]|uniref:Phage integrase family protein n=1 Tax=Marinisporobacter balticus TaxID=2018667 RepID=A0A4R2K9T8_9FIRM|nr:tyrosine-type recombinase/integrase [Marinisporobacter balticus]TCO69514.1 phage integrase family protein [Marinisporobacter balticus]
MGKKRPANPIKDIERVFDIQDYLKYKNERDYTLFALGIGTGYRAGDLIELRVRDVKKALRIGYFLILENKKKNTQNIRKENIKPREAKIPKKLEKILKDYTKDKKDYEFMFKSRKGTGSIQVKQVSRILSEAGEKFGLYNITAHSMRKTYAYTIYRESGFDIVAVKEMLGHATIEITKRYLGLDRELYDKYSNTLNQLFN